MNSLLLLDVDEFKSFLTTRNLLMKMNRDI